MFECTYCHKTYYSVGNLNRHITTIHGIKKIKRTMECLSCENKFTRRIKLAEHLKKDHGQDFEVELLEFKTSEEFETWRAEEERKSVSMFRIANVDRPSKNGSTTTLICSRDGQARPKVLKMRKRSLKSQGSRKIGHTCTSHMIINKVTEPESKILVKYVRTHYGHEPEVQHVNLSPTDKEKIAKQLAIGVSEAQIIADAKSNEAEPSRLGVLSKKDIANIRTQYGLGLVVKQKYGMYCSPVKQCSDCKICRLTCSCPNILLDTNSICKHIHCVARQTLGQESPLQTTTNEDTAALKQTRTRQTSTDLSLKLQEEFTTFVDEFSKYKDKFSSLSKASQKKVIRLFRTASILLKGESGEDALKETQPVTQMNRRKRKISKQEVFCKTVKDVQLKKKNKETQKSSEPSPRRKQLFATELLFNEFAPLFVYPVDHEEIVTVSERMVI